MSLIQCVVNRHSSPCSMASNFDILNGACLIFKCSCKVLIPPKNFLNILEVYFQLFIWTLFAGHLVMSCNTSLFVELIDFLLTELSKNSSTSTTRTYIQCVGTIRCLDNPQLLNILFMPTRIKMDNKFTLMSEFVETCAMFRPASTGLDQDLLKQAET